LDTLIALTTIVKIPKGAIATIMLSAQDVERLRNCFVAWSPKRARSGVKSLKKLFAKSSAADELADEVAVAVDATITVVVAISVRILAGGSLSEEKRLHDIDRAERHRSHYCVPYLHKPSCKTLAVTSVVRFA
jgi:hypothetical protein